MRTSSGLSVVGVQQIDRVVEVVEETLKGHAVRLLGKKKQLGKKIGGAPLNLPKIRKNPLIEIISINTGCLNQVLGDLSPEYSVNFFFKNCANFGEIRSFFYKSFMMNIRTFLLGKFET